MALASLLHADNVGTPGTLIDEVAGAGWTLSGGATQTAAGALYGAGSLDLTGNTVASPRFAKTTIGASRLFTIEFSCKSSAGVNFFCTIADTDQWNFGFRNFGQQIQFFGTTPPAFLPNNAFDGNRHDYAISRDGANNYYFHQDGQYIGTFNANYGFGANTYVRIGSIDGSGQDPFDGLLDEIRINWDVQLYGAANYTPSLPFPNPSAGGAALTGVGATGSVGTLAPAADAALTGVGATGSVGTVAPTTSRALTGLAGTGSVGTVTATRAIALTGAGATGEVGSVSAGSDVTAALTGVEALGQVGDVTAGADITAALTGVAALASVGDLVAGAALVLGGVEALGQVGSLTAGNDVTAALTGAAATGSVGTLTPEEALALTGAAATGQVGSVVPTVTVVVDLAGVEATGAAGNVSAGSDVTVGLSGVAGSGQVGALAPSILVDRVLTGVEAVAAFGTLVPGVSVGLTGVQATGQVGTLSTDVPPTRWNYGTIGPEYRTATIAGEFRTWRMTP